MDSRLELRLADTSPKCGTCAYFGGGTAGKCSVWQLQVLDLAVCSNWSERLELEAVKE